MQRLAPVGGHCQDRHMRLSRASRIAALLCAGTLTATGCATSGTNEIQLAGDDDVAANATAGFPCTGYPSAGTTTPANLPLPTAEINGSGQYVTGSVTGPTSWFGGPKGGAPGPFALTQQWDPDGWHRNPGVPYGMEIGDKPCNDATQAGVFRSYFAAMRFSPREDSPKATAYSKYAPYATDPRYAKWNGGPLIAEMAQPLSFLYGRKLAVSRTVNGKTYAVIVRAADRGPTEGKPWGERPVDLSPWAMGALTGNPKCLDWDGSDPNLTRLCDFTGDKATNVVTVRWADNSAPLGPTSASR